MKAGLKTSELWISVLTMGMGMIGTIPLPPIAYVIIPGLYTIARGLAKLGYIRGTGGEILTGLPEK